MGQDEPEETKVRVCSLDELQQERRRVVTAAGHTILVVLDQGRVFALDNRCPHMGFPLHRGTVKDGILTCHWHHARFDLAGGCTFDPFADDVPSFPVEVRDGQVWVGLRPAGADARGRSTGKLREGLEHGIRLVLAKSVIGLLELGATDEVVATIAGFGLRHRAAGWSSGLSILTAMANVLPALSATDRRVALYQAAVQVARSTQGQPSRFDLDPLDTTETRPERHREWFRRFVESRSSAAAERTLRAAIGLGLPPTRVAELVFAACTDHPYLDEGHALDFAGKAFELLDHLGWARAAEVLPSLVPGLARAERMEETGPWRHPVDLPALLAEAGRDLEELVAAGTRRPQPAWSGHLDLAELVLDAEPAETVGRLRALIADGVPLVELSGAVAYAAARRLVHFHVSNELGDWDTVHHAFTYANAADQALRRAGSAAVARPLFDGAMAIYLARFLNVPRAPIPAAGRGTATEADLLAAFDVQGHVDETAAIVADLLGQGRREAVVRTLGHALLREDAAFHQFQVFEAAVRQQRRLGATPAGDHVLIGAARFLAAHSPTVRGVGQTFDIAARLHRGDALHGGD